MKRIGFVVLVLTFIMVGTFAFGATFTDVKGTKYQEAVDLLTKLKIVNGRTTDTFVPGDAVKRSEMAKMLVVAMGKEADAEKSKGKTKFPDVSEKHWASGYINVATELGLIKGYPDGTFAPEDTVSYVESIAMLLRALNYEDVDKLAWPDGYVERAKNIKLTNNVTISNSGDGAIRGNVAILVWNTLKSNVREIIGSNSSGMIYGDGETLINKGLENYTYLQDATITDVDIDKDEITITDSKKKSQTYAYDTTEKKLLELYGKEVTALYDKKEKEFISFDISTSNKTIYGEIDDVTSSKITIDNKTYTLPSSSNIKLMGVTNIKNATEAYITTKNGNVTYVLAIGKDELHYGIAVSDSAKSNGKYKVELADLDGYEDVYVLEDQTLSIYEGDILIYYLNEDDEIVVEYLRYLDDAYEIDSVTKNSIKLVGKTKYEYSSSDEVMIIAVENGEITEMSSLAFADEDYDLALMIDTGKEVVIIVYIDALDDDGNITGSASSTKSAAKNRLNAAITLAKKKVETKYTIASYDAMQKKLEAAEDINQSVASISTMDKASEALEKAINNLKTATTTDKNLRSTFADLQAAIKEAKAIKESDYTSATYKVLTTAITAAEKIVITNTTVAKMQSAINDIDEAMDGLISNIAADELSKMKDEITTLIKEAESKRSSDYTEESFKRLQTALEEARKADYNKMTLVKLKNISNNLYTALEKLVSVNRLNFETAINNYKEQAERVSKLKESDYTKASWEKVQSYLIDVDKEYKDIKDEDLSRKTAELNEKTNNLKNAIDDLFPTAEYLAKEELKKTITYARKIEQADWDEDSKGISYTEFTKKINSAEEVLNSSSSSAEEIKRVDEELQKYFY